MDHPGPPRLAEVRGVPSALLQHWSSRRAEIEAEARTQAAEREAALGRALTTEERRELFQDAVLATRPPKSRCGEGIDRTVFARWWTDSAEAGFTPERWLDGTLGRATWRAREVPGLADDVLAEWAVPPARLKEMPTDALQRTGWRTEVRDARAAMRLFDRVISRGLERGRSLSQGLGLER